jgi:hypothetical protein
MASIVDTHTTLTLVWHNAMIAFALVFKTHLVMPLAQNVAIKSLFLALSAKPHGLVLRPALAGFRLGHTSSLAVWFD